METADLHVEGMDAYRRVLLFGSLIDSIITILILGSEPRLCEGTNLIAAIWLAFGVQLSVFIMLLLHYIKLGSCFKAIGRGIWLYYLYLVGSVLWLQVMFF